MSCAYCAYFLRPKEWWKEPRVDGVDRWLSGPGSCTLYPEWREVTGEHFCGQLRLTAEKMEDVREYRIRISEGATALDTARDEIKRLRKRVKAGRVGRTPTNRAIGADSERK